MTNSKTPQSWADHQKPPLSEEEIRKQFTPAENYRFFRHTYPKGSRFSGTTRSTITFILSGSATYKFEESNLISLKSGEFACLPSGKFEFAASDNNDVDLVNVWSLLDI